MTQSPARRLVVSYCFPPYADTSAIVVAKRLRDWAEPVDVVCCDLSTMRSIDPTLTEIAGPWVRRFHAVPTRPSFENWQRMVEFTQSGLATVMRWQQEQGEYEQMYSRAQFAASHVLAASIKALQPGVRWTAEFSDPLTRDAQGTIRTAPVTDDAVIDTLRDEITTRGYTPPADLNMYAWVETAVYAMADEIIFTNANQRAYMMSVCEDAHLRDAVLAKSTISPHPTPAAEFYDLVPGTFDYEPGIVNMGYFGNFYANRGLGMFLDALSGIEERFRRRLMLHVFTADAKNLMELAEQRGVAEHVRVQKQLPFLEFLNVAKQMDVLIVNDAEFTAGADNPFLPSKWSDYKGSGTAVWGILDKNSPLTKETLAYKTGLDSQSATEQALCSIAALEPKTTRAYASSTTPRP